MSNVLAIAKKELSTFFSSPMAYIFLGTFLFVLFFIFFWVEGFFARNIADVRPLFEWMPLLLIFLVSALTMKMWSEERRMGTLEFLLTMPVKTHHLVFGKFLACMGLVLVALMLTLGIPLIVSFLGVFDWGPVVGAYVASVLLAGAYISIGLYLSSRSENQIVSLILTVAICSLFYLVGSGLVGGLFGYRSGEILKLLGTGSRFESVCRGVIDLRDIYYYVSVTGIFLALNTLYLEELKWSPGVKSKWHRLLTIVTFLIIANFALANFWLARVHFSRVDLTRGNLYSISQSTKNLMEQLQEPLLIRGYFSAKTHPLLSPLVPQIRDTLREYGIAGGGKVRVEFVDPREDEELEAEANSKYGIKPIPFQFSDRYKAEVVNSYFNILIQYGDQYEVLNFNDVIEVRSKGETDLDVQLKNLEYDITRSIKKVLYGFQNIDQLFASLKKPVRFVGYVSEKNLPQPLKELSVKLETVLSDYKKSAGDKFDYEFQDPIADSHLAAEIQESYGFQPMALNLFDNNRFYFYLTLQDEETIVSLQIPEDLSEEAFKQGIESALKRFAPGFLKTVGLVLPPQPMPQNPYMQQLMDDVGLFRFLEKKLGENYTAEEINLKKGFVGEEVDVLLVVAPQELGPKELFAVDQYLMKGGSVILASSPFSVAKTKEGLKANNQKSGLEEWLKNFGIEIKEEMVLDPQNSNFPVMVNRNLGGFSVQEVRMVNYPYSVDVREDGMNQKNALLSGIPQLTMYWASPISFDAEKNKDRQVVELLHSSDESWTSSSLDLEPDYNSYPEFGFPNEGQAGGQLVAAIVEGPFTSFYKDKQSPLFLEEESEDEEEESKLKLTGHIDKSPDSARLIIFASNEFIKDQTLQMSSAAGTSQYLNNLQIMENAIDWSVEDRSLLSIRGRGHYSKTMIPMKKKTQIFLEYLNYFISLVGLFIVFGVHKLVQKRAKKRFLELKFACICI